MHKHRHREQTCSCQRGGGWGRDGLGGWVSRSKMYSMDKQQDPTIYSTENYINYPMINHNGKEYFKMYVYIT